MLASFLVNLVRKIARQELYFVMIANVGVFFFLKLLGAT